MPMDGERIREAMGGPARVRPSVPMTHTMASEARGSGTAYEHGHGGASWLVNGTLVWGDRKEGGLGIVPPQWSQVTVLCY